MKAILNNNFIDDNIILAGFSVRVCAYLIDLIFINFLLIIVRSFAWIIKLFNPNMFFFKTILFDFSLYNIFIYIIISLYFIITTYYFHATLGKKIMKIKVENINGEKLTIFNVIYRETIGRFLSSILYIGYIMISLDKYKMGIHDKLCNTCVIYNKSQFIVLKRSNESHIKGEKNFDNEIHKQDNDDIKDELNIHIDDDLNDSKE